MLFRGMILLRAKGALRVLFRKMTSIMIREAIPGSVREMKVLEAEKFSCSLSVPVLKVSDTNLSVTIQTVRPYFLKLLNFKPVQDSGSSSCQKIIHLLPTKVASWSDFPTKDQEKLEQNGISEKNFCYKDLKLNYSNFTYDEIFKAVLPENEEIVSGFSQIGHIIHLNLKDHLIEYKSLIGQVLVDKVKTCRTVVNKSNTIDNAYRNFQMEVLAGEEDFMVTVKENSCNFHFDFSKVYWNPRLCKEHERILSLLNPCDALFDVFCGVGPFAIPATKKKCKVFANDLNPDSYKWLNHNAKANKLNMMLFNSYNMDGKDFILTIFKDYLTNNEKNNSGSVSKIHVTMNLPALAVEFLKYFKGLLSVENVNEIVLCDIFVYVYCFVYGENEDALVAEARKLVIEKIGMDISENVIEIFNVRKVAPAKVMMRVTFKLTKDVIFCEHSVCEEPPCKKLCNT